VGIGASRTLGFHPWVARGAPVLEVHATTGKATATSPLSGAVVVVEVCDEADAAVGLAVVAVVASNEVPHPERAVPKATTVLTTRAVPTTGRRRCRRNDQVVLFLLITVSDAKPTPASKGAIPWVTGVPPVDPRGRACRD
jgi:hypothetical protein